MMVRCETRRGRFLALGGDAGLAALCSDFTRVVAWRYAPSFILALSSGGTCFVAAINIHPQLKPCSNS